MNKASGTCWYEVFGPIYSPFIESRGGGICDHMVPMTPPVCLQRYQPNVRLSRYHPHLLVEHARVQNRL